MTGLRCTRENNRSTEACITQSLRTELELHMKSMGLALTIFVLTGALAVLDLSGTYVVHASVAEVAAPGTASPASLPLASEPVNSDQESAENADEPDGETLNAFLVSPWPLAPVKGSKAATLRYD
jgi:hypothetical protein